MTVDEFVSTRVPLELRPIVGALRTFMRKHAPLAQEEMGYGIPMYRGNKVLAVISPTKKDITFAFSRGAEFEDIFGLLSGAGTRSKHVKLKHLDDLNLPALRYYLEQAVALDRKGT